MSEQKLIEEARAPEGLTLAECFEWMRRYRWEPFSTLSRATTAAKDYSPLRVMASLGWHAKNRADALEAALVREQGAITLAREVIDDLKETCDCADHVEIIRVYRERLAALAAVPVETQEAKANAELRADRDEGWRQYNRAVLALAESQLARGSGGDPEGHDLLIEAEVAFLNASIAVWQEIDRLTEENGTYPGLPQSSELRQREKAAWEHYRDTLAVETQEAVAPDNYTRPGWRMFPVL